MEDSLSHSLCSHDTNRYPPPTRTANYFFLSALVLFWTDMQTATFLNDFLNTVMSIMLPFAIMPTLCFTSSPFVMGEFANGFFNKIAVCVLGLIVIGINVSYVIQYVGEHVPSE